MVFRLFFVSATTILILKAHLRQGKIEPKLNHKGAVLRCILISQGSAYRQKMYNAGRSLLVYGSSATKTHLRVGHSEEVIQRTERFSSYSSLNGRMWISENFIEWIFRLWRMFLCSWSALLQFTLNPTFTSCKIKNKTFFKRTTLQRLQRGNRKIWTYFLYKPVGLTWTQFSWHCPCKPKIYDNCLLKRKQYKNNSSRNYSWYAPRCSDFLFFS